MLTTGKISLFVLSINPKHYSNENEAMKVLQDIVVPYVVRERESLKLAEDHPALLIMDVFKGQMTENVFKFLCDKHIIRRTVPANLTYLFNLQMSKEAKWVCKAANEKKFTDWKANQLASSGCRSRDRHSIFH